MLTKAHKILILVAIIATVGLAYLFLYRIDRLEVGDPGVQTISANVNTTNSNKEIVVIKEELVVTKPNIVQNLVTKVEQKVAVVNDTYLTKPNVLLPVAFASQAPLLNWDALHQEACEEASMIMAYHYYNDLALNNSIMEEAIQKQIAWQGENGYEVDVTAAQVQVILSKYYSLESKLVKNPTAADIETALSTDQLVIVPAAGRQLGNPNFRNPGPVYHMLVVIGYDSKQKEFITNDPGTRNGAKYRYSYDVLLNAIHDWNGGDVANGEKVIVVVKKPQ